MSTSLPWQLRVRSFLHIELDQGQVLDSGLILVHDRCFQVLSYPIWRGEGSCKQRQVRLRGMQM